MKIYVPLNSTVDDYDALFKRLGLDVVWVESEEDIGNPIPDNGEQLETVSVRGDDNFDNEVFERSVGEILILERFIRDDYTYGVLGKVTPADFYSELGLPTSGPCIGADISDRLVKAFDIGLGEEFGINHSCTFAYRDPQGRVIFQHST